MAKWTGPVISRARYRTSTITPAQMIRIATPVVQSIRTRIFMALDVNDAPAPPLSDRSKYKKLKIRRGGRGIRDWVRPPSFKSGGITMKSLNVLQAGIGFAIIGFTNPLGAFRAMMNNLRHKQFGVSRRDWRVFSSSTHRELRQFVRTEQL
jgi:hypothetical protein